MKDHNHNHNPVAGLARFLIALGLVMLAARMDILHLGDPSEYFTWEILVMFFGLMALLNLEFVGAVICFAVGFYFIMPEMHLQLTPFYKDIYWPAALILVGLAFMITPIFKKRRIHNK